MPDWIPGTVDMGYTPSVGVAGVGRVGSYASAVRRKACRARRYWIVIYWDGTRSATGYAQGRVPGQYRTGRDAAQAAVEFAKVKRWTVDSYAQSLLGPINPENGKRDPENGMGLKKMK